MFAKWHQYSIYTSLIYRLWGEPASVSEIPHLFHGASNQLIEASERNTLLELPNELLLSVADFLSWCDVTCFSLCCRGLFHTYFRKRFMRPSRTDKLLLLQRLEQDLPSYFTCHGCQLLHKFDASQDPKVDMPLYNFAFRCREKWWKSSDLDPQHSPNYFLNRQKYLDLILDFQRFLSFNHYQDVDYNLYFTHVQLVMRAFHRGPQFGISPENLFYTQVRTNPKRSDQPEITSLFSIDAQICSQPPGLIIRIQQILFVAGCKRSLLFYNPKYEYIDPNIPGRPQPGWYICAHISDNDLAPLVNSIVAAHFVGDAALPSTHYCDWCGTYFCIDLCKCGEDLAFTITRWINLGAGLTPDDPNWAKHSLGEVDSVEHRSDNLRTVPRGNITNARSYFEDASLQRLRDCNISYLKNQRYREVMQSDGFHSGWKLRNTCYT